MEPENRFSIEFYRVYFYMRFFDKDFKYYYRDYSTAAELKNRVVHDINVTLEDKGINSHMYLMDDAYDYLMSYVDDIFEKYGNQINEAIVEAPFKPQPTKFKIFRVSDYGDYV